MFANVASSIAVTRNGAQTSIATREMAVVLVLGITGCGKKTEEAKETKDGLKVVLLITSNLGDKGFYDSANDGMKLIEKELGAEVKTIEMGQDPSKYEPYFRDVAEQDWDYIIVGSSPAVEIAEALIPEYPDKKFIMFDTEVDWSKGDFSNLYCVQYKQNEGSFLAGAVAAVMTTEGKNANPDKVIGCIGGGDLPIINDFMIGYIRGAQHVESDIKVAVAYAGTFVDSAKGKELALSQMSQQNVDICFQIASQTGIGVLDAAKEKGLYAIGVDGDQAAETILSMENITKIYSNGFITNKNVNFELRRGEIHALAGENGAGKSTLMKVLFGEEQCEEGRILYKGKEVKIDSPLSAIKMGIGMVHQHFMLVQSMTVAENMVLGLEPEKAGFLDKEEAKKRTREVSEKYGLEIDPDAPGNSRDFPRTKTA